MSSGVENGWESDDKVAVIWHEPTFNQIVIDTYNHDAQAASLSSDEARAAAAALRRFAKLADQQRATE